MGSTASPCVPFVQVQHGWLGSLERVTTEDAMYSILLVFRRLPSLHGVCREINKYSCWFRWICADFIQLKVWNLAWKSVLLGKCFVDQAFLLGRTKEADGKLAERVAWMQDDGRSAAAGELLAWQKVRWQGGRRCLCQWVLRKQP